MPEQKELTKVIVGGFGYSGSSAVIDWLREQPTCSVFPVEWDFFRQPDGLQDLRCALTRRVSNRRAYIALKRFMYLSVTMCRPNGQVFGRGYEDLAYPGLEQDLLDFARSLIALSIPSPITAKWLEDHQVYQVRSETSGVFPAVTASLMRKLRRNPSKFKEQLLSQTLKLLDRRLYDALTDELAPRDLLLPSLMTAESFDAHSRVHFDKIARKLAGADSEYLVLHNGFSNAGVKDGLNLMTNTKAIYVHRDPRDVFMTSVTENLDVIPVDSVESFARWFQIAMPKPDMHDPRIRVIAFDDLVQKPDLVLDHLADFLGIQETSGPLRRTLFNPDVSAKNSGKWRRYEDQEKMQQVWDATQDHYQHVCDQSVKFDT